MALAILVETTTPQRRWTAPHDTAPTLPPRRRTAAVERRPVLVGVAVAVALIVASLVVTPLVSALSGAIDGGGSPGSAGAASPAVPAAASPARSGPAHVVASGETLWSIAAALAPGDDDAAAFDAIVRLNGTDTVAVGDLVRLPS